MLTITNTFNTPPFIRYAESGFVTLVPALRFCLVQFDKNCYQDTLFILLDQTLPESFATANIKRKAEYLAGRYCARWLLQQVGCKEDKLINSCQRVPIWPSGWCGSISHTGEQAIAILAPLSAKLSPGIDIEQACSKNILKIAKVCATPQEQAIISNIPLPYYRTLSILFSAKESLYKSLWPRVQCSFGFNTVMLTALNVTQQSFTLTLTTNLTPSLQRGKVFAGIYHFVEDIVITCIC